VRRLNRLLALVLGIAVAGVAVVTGIEIVALASGSSAVLIPRHSWDHGLHRLRWASAGAGVASGIVATVGVVLLLVQIIPRRPVRLPLRSLAGERVFLSRRGLARRLSLDVADLDEVSAVKVRVTARAVRATAALAAGIDRKAGADAVRQTLQATLDHVAPTHRFRVRVSADVKEPPVKKGSRRARLDDPNIGRADTAEPEQAA
jgi:hypothetical protein